MKSLSFFVAVVAPVVALHPGSYEIVAHLRQRNLETFEKLFWDVANPKHERYLKQLAIDDVANIIGASDDEITSARKYLISNGAIPSSIRVSALRDTVIGTFASRLTSDNSGVAPHEFVSLLSAEKPDSVEFLMRRDPQPDRSSNLLATRKAPMRDTFGQYTVPNIKKAYGIPTDLQASNESTLQMVWGPGTFGYSASQLGQFKEIQCPLLNMDKVKFDTENHGKSGGDNYGEGNLDTQMISSFGLNVQTLVSNTNVSASTEEG